MGEPKDMAGFSYVLLPSSVGNVDKMHIGKKDGFSVFGEKASSKDVAEL